MQFASPIFFTVHPPTRDKHSTALCLITSRHGKPKKNMWSIMCRSQHAYAVKASAYPATQSSKRWTYPGKARSPSLLYSLSLFSFAATGAFFFFFPRFPFREFIPIVVQSARPHVSQHPPVLLVPEGMKRAVVGGWAGVGCVGGAVMYSGSVSGPYSVTNDQIITIALFLGFLCCEICREI